MNVYDAICPRGVASPARGNPMPNERLWGVADFVAPFLNVRAEIDLDADHYEYIIEACGLWSQRWRSAPVPDGAEQTEWKSTAPQTHRSRCVGN